MKTRSTLGGVAAVCLLAAGCQSAVTDGSWVGSLQPNAIKTATARAQQDLSCTSLTPNVISSKGMPPEYSGPRFVTPERAVFTIGIEGCGKRSSYVVVCERDLAKDCGIGGPGN
jgi:hypothetical protein